MFYILFGKIFKSEILTDNCIAEVAGMKKNLDFQSWGCGWARGDQGSSPNNFSLF